VRRTFFITLMFFVAAIFDAVPTGNENVSQRWANFSILKAISWNLLERFRSDNLFKKLRK